MAERRLDVAYRNGILPLALCEFVAWSGADLVCVMSHQYQAGIK